MTRAHWSSPMAPRDAASTTNARRLRQLGQAARQAAASLRKVGLAIWRSPTRIEGLAAITVAAWTSAAMATPFAPKDLPEPLRPWAAWALWGHESRTCPFLFNDQTQRRCSFPASLSLDATDDGASFKMGLALGVRGVAALPGSDEHFPQDVQVDGKRVPVTLVNGVPGVLLEPGDHEVTGRLPWDTLPEAIAIPPGTALVELTLKGRKHDFMQLDAQGRVSLQGRKQKEEASESDSLEIQAFRKIDDDVPLTMTLSLRLRVAGRNREVLLGPLFGPGFVVQSLKSPLSTRLEPDGRLRVSLRPGNDHLLEITARSPAILNKLTLPPIEAPWPEDEVWVFDARPALRQVTIEGVPSIDPAQTELPAAWKAYPAYRLSAGQTLELIERKRGEPEPAPDAIHVARDIWLDFSGDAYTIKDRLSGEASSSWRLSVQKPVELGRVASGGQNLLITALEQEPAGVEIRSGKLAIEADMRHPRDGARLPASLWSFDLQSLAAHLHLPPGWSLLAATGVDAVHGSWLSTWNLMNLFLALIVAFAVGRLSGLVWGVVALACQVLVIPETDAPTYAILALLPALALRRVLPSASKLRRAVAVYFTLASVAVLLVSAAFAVGQLREALYPTLEKPFARLDTYSHDEPHVVDTAMRPEIAHKAMEELEDVQQEATAPAAPKAPVEIQRDMNLGKMGGSMRAPQAKKSGYLQKGSQKQQLTQNAPDAVIQTGQGIPIWGWNRIALRWSGPVAKDQDIRLFLVPPALNFVQKLARVALLSALLFGLLGQELRRQWPRLSGPRASVAGSTALLLLSLLAPEPAAAQTAIPSDQLLNELRERLLAKEACNDACASLSRLDLRLEDGLLRLTLEAHALADTVVPLPGNAQRWLASDILVDGAAARRLVRDENGSVLVALTPGTHQIVLRGRMPARDSVQIDLPLKPRLVTATAPGFTVEGLHENGLADDALVLVGAAKPKPEGDGEGDGSLDAALPPFLRLSRELVLDLTWMIETKVTRVAGGDGAVVLRVPLLSGERVTQAGVRVDKGHVLVNMGPSEDEVIWRSALDPSERIELKAAEATSWVEQWSLNASPVWHVELSGIPVVHHRSEDGFHLPQWLPWPGEQVAIKVSRPTAVAGRTLTLDKAQLEVSPGLRQSHAKLSLELRASRGGEHRFTLPEGADFQALSINDKAPPIRPEKGVVTLPIVPGAQKVVVEWRDPRGIGAFFQAPPVDVGMPGVNAMISLRPPTDRWILLVGGGGAGPAVLFWSKILVLALSAFVLGRIPMTPLRTHHWLLLGLGLLQTELSTLFVVFGFVLALGARARHGALKSTALFNLMQVGLALWAVLVAGTVLAALEQGFFGRPDMEITGNGSSASELIWYKDRFEAVLPQAWMVSLPMITYQVAMLVWALWFAQFVVKRAKWAFDCYAAHGLWRKVTRRAAVPRASAAAEAPAGQAAPSPDDLAGISPPSGKLD